MTTLFPDLEPSAPSELERARRRLEALRADYYSDHPVSLDVKFQQKWAMEDAEREVARLERMALK